MLIFIRNRIFAKGKHKNFITIIQSLIQIIGRYTARCIRTNIRNDIITRL